MLAAAEGGYDGDLGGGSDGIVKGERDDFAVEGEGELGPESAAFDDASVETGTAGIDGLEQLVDGGCGELEL